MRTTNQLLELIAQVQGMITVSTVTSELKTKYRADLGKITDKLKDTK